MHRKSSIARRDPFKQMAFFPFLFSFLPKVRVCVPIYRANLPFGATHFKYTFQGKELIERKQRKFIAT